MHKFLLTLITTIAFTTAVFAQTEATDDIIIPQKKHGIVTNTFWSNWFVSVGAEYAATYSSQEIAGVPSSPFLRERRNSGAMIALGKWITPTYGVRLKVQGVEHKALTTRSIYHDFDSWHGHLDALINLSNLCCGYNEQRVYNLIPYVGFGVTRNASNNTYASSYHVGLLNNFRISNRLTLFAELYANAAYGTVDGSPTVNPKFWTSRQWDKQVGASVGFTINLGKSKWEKVPDVDALITMTNEQRYALTTAYEALQTQVEQMAQQPTEASKSGHIAATTEEQPASATAVLSVPVSVFFKLNRSNIAAKQDLVDVRAMADYAKANGKKLLIKGYADNATGNATYNHHLAQKRAEVLADFLANYGIARENILIEVVGGTQELTPIVYNRRATVELR